MSADQHRGKGGDAPLTVAVLTVSSKRTEADDPTGDLIVDRVTSNGHRVVRRQVLDDEIDGIRRAVQQVVDTDVQLAILSGGTGLTARDVTPEALEPMFRRAIPGFGELFRVLSYSEIGAAAMRSRATAGMVGRTVVFALPGSLEAARLALRDLVLPEARHLVFLARKGEARHGRGWQGALAAASARLRRDIEEPLPKALASIPPIRALLAEAGEVGVAEVGQWRYSLWGYPDLVGIRSRVIAVSPGGGLGEVVALHRHPASVGTCIKGEGGWVTSRDRPVAEVATALTGAPPPEGGALFAVGEGIVQVERAGRVFAWDGTTRTDLGTPPEALTHLVSEWTVA